MSDYSKMSQEDYDDILHEIVMEMSPASILSIPGVYEILREELNNEILSRWKDEPIN